MAKKFDISNSEKESISAYFQTKKPEEKKPEAKAAAPKAEPVKTIAKKAEKQPVKASPAPSGKAPNKTPVKAAKPENKPSEASAEAKENRSKRISVLTTPEIFKNVNALSSLYGISVNEIINSQLEKYITENNKDLSFALELVERTEQYKGGRK